MEKRKLLYIIFSILSAVVVLSCLYFSYPCIPVWKQSIDKAWTASVYGKKVLVVDKMGKRLFVVNEEGKVVFSRNPSRLTKVPDYIEDATLDDRFLYIAGHDTNNGGVYCTCEHIEQYDKYGRHVRTVYSKKIPETEQSTHSELVTIHTYNGKLYAVQIAPSQHDVSVFCFDGNGGSKKILSAECPFEIAYADYDCKNNKLCAVDYFNRGYVVTDKIKLHRADIAEFFPGNRDEINMALPALARLTQINYLVLSNSWCYPIYENNGSCSAYLFISDLANAVTVYNLRTQKAIKISEFPCCMSMILVRAVNFMAVIWLCFVFLHLIWLLLAKNKLINRKKYVYIICGLFISVCLILYYSYNIGIVLKEQYKAKTYALSYLCIHDLEHILPDFMRQVTLHGVASYVADPVHQKKTGLVLEHFTALCADSGENDHFYVRLMFCGTNKTLINYIDTVGDYPCGYHFKTSALEIGLHAIAADGWIEKDTSSGRVVAYYRPLYDSKNILAGIVETGYYTENLQRLALKKSLYLFACLLVILLCLVPVLLYIFRRRKEKGGEES